MDLITSFFCCVTGCLCATAALPEPYQPIRQGIPVIPGERVEQRFGANPRLPGESRLAWRLRTGR